MTHYKRPILPPLEDLTVSDLFDDIKDVVRRHDERINPPTIKEMLDEFAGMVRAAKNLQCGLADLAGYYPDEDIDLGMMPIEGNA